MAVAIPIVTVIAPSMPGLSAAAVAAALPRCRGRPGVPLVGLNLGWYGGVPSEVKDVSMLRGMPLKFLDLTACTALTDLSPILGCPDLDVLWTTTTGLAVSEADTEALQR